MDIEAACRSSEEGGAVDSGAEREYNDSANEKSERYPRCLKHLSSACLYAMGSAHVTYTVLISRYDGRRRSIGVDSPVVMSSCTFRRSRRCSRRNIAISHTPAVSSGRSRIARRVYSVLIPTPDV